MSSVVIVIILGVLGLLFGSFAGATVWRLRARQLRKDEAAGEKVAAADKREVKLLTEQKITQDRSRCLHCGHTLAWYDLVPLVSWFSLRGKCRYCRHSIGYFEPLMEVGMAAFFVVSFLFWPHPLETGFGVVTLMLWLAAGVGLGILFAYDAKWFLLPNRVMFSVIGIGLLYSAVVFADQHFSLEVFRDIVFACVILSGLYYIIHILSRGAWIGFGDVKLGLALALLLADWQLAFLALFLANLFGAVLLLPFMALGKVKRHTQVPFGPLLIAGWFVAGLFGVRIIDWYMSITLGLV